MCEYIDTQVYTVSQVPQLGIKEYCVNILRKVTKKWIQLLLLQTIIVWCRAAHWLKIYWSRKTCKVWSWKMSLWLFSPYQLTWHQDAVTKVKWKDCSQLCAIPSLRLRVDQLWIQDKASPILLHSWWKNVIQLLLHRKLFQRVLVPQFHTCAPASKSWPSSRMQTRISDLCIQETFHKCSVLDV